MIVDRDLLQHWKLKSLIQVIGRGEALTALLSLWAHCEARKAWEFKLTPLMLAGICAYEGKGRTPMEREQEAGTLFSTMLTLAFIEKAEEDGWYSVHDWGERNAGLHVKWPGKHGFEWHPRGYPVKRGETSPSGTPPPPPRGTAKGAPIPTPDRIGEDRIGEEKPPVVPQGGPQTAPSPAASSPTGTPTSKPEGAKQPKKKRRGSAAGAPTPMPVPEGWSERRRAIMLNWTAYKLQQFRFSYQALGWQAQITMIACLTDDQLEACVNDSMARGYQGLFPSKFGGNHPEFHLPPGAQKEEGGGGPALSQADYERAYEACFGGAPAEPFEHIHPSTQATLLRWLDQNGGTARP